MMNLLKVQRKCPGVGSGRIAARLMLATALWGAVLPCARAAETGLANVPIPASQEAVPANVMLALSVEFPTAQSHANFSSALAANSTSDSLFEKTRKYLGYFDPTKCYTYDTTNTYFKPSGNTTNVTNSFKCPGEWSGNYLNWATMSVLDLFRWALTGGARDIDLPLDFSATTPVGTTVLKKSWSSNQGSQQNFPDKSLSSGDITSYTPFIPSGPNVGKNLVAVVLNKGLNVEFSYSSGTTAGGTVYKSFPVRVLVCDGTDQTKHEYPDNYYCQKYQSPDDKTKFVYKPVGLIQKNIDRMRFGAVSYLNLNNDTYGNDTQLQAVDGGVLKAHINDSKTYEILSTGAFPADPYPADKGGDADVTKTGAINYLNSFGYGAKSYKRYDNVSEMYAVALRYLLGPKGIGNVAGYSSIPPVPNSGSVPSLTAAQKKAIKDDFPVISTWKDPVLSADAGGMCQKQFVIGVGDTNTCCDSNLSGGVTPVNAVVAGERFAGKTANYWVTQIPGYDLTHDYIAGLAFAANTQALRSDFPDMRIKTFWLDVLEFSHKAPNNQYQKAAKYGAFKDVNNNGVPDEGEWNALKQTYAGEVLPDAYFPASDPDRMLTGLSSAFSQINAMIGAAAGAALQSSAISTTATTDGVYLTSYNSQYWSGDLQGFTIDASTTLGVIKTSLVWSAASLLDAKVAGTGWDTARKVVTLAPNSSGVLVGVPFRIGSLSTAQKATLGATTTEQSDILNYLRGDTSKQSTLTTRNTYRYRASVLGDIVDSAALYVGPPSEVYSDAYNPGYSAFVAAKASRTPVVYVGANDGMLHAFDARVSGTGGGAELFAVVPNAMFAGPDGVPVESGLKALSGNDYLHHYYVNATPFARDVDFARAGGVIETNSARSDWRTLLVTGLGKGGRSYVAMDVTDVPTSSTSEATIAGKVLWEFTHEDMGFSYGRPFIVKTRKWGWVVVIAAGYNNNLGVSSSSAPGKGVVFVLNPTNGALLQKITTSAGSVTTPSGLAHLSGYVQDYADMTMDQLYAGDLLGNVWRFDFMSPTLSVPSETTPIAILRDVDGNPQPVTTEPLIEIAPDLVRYVFVGTGRLLHTNDRDSTQRQTFYAVRDGTVTNPYSTAAGAPNPLPSGVTFPVGRSQMVQVANLIEGVTMDSSKPMGWYYDLIETADSPKAPAGASKGPEQVVINPQANEGVVSWVGSAMTQDKCNPAGVSSTYAVKYGTAKSVFSLLDATSNAVTVQGSIPSSVGLAGLRLVRYGSTIRLVGSRSDASAPSFVGSQVSGFGDPRVLNWRIIGQ